MKPRVKARGRMIGPGVPLDAEPGDLVLGNRGAGARVVELWSTGRYSSCLTLEEAGNFGMGKVWNEHGKIYDGR